VHALDNVTREARKSLSLRGWQELAAWHGEHEQWGEERRAGGKICAAAGVAVVEQGRHGQHWEADTTEAEASAGVGKGNYDLAAATKGAGRW